MSPQEALAALMAAKPDWGWHVTAYHTTRAPESTYSISGFVPQWKVGDGATIHVSFVRDLDAAVAEALAKAAERDWDPYAEVA